MLLLIIPLLSYFSEFGRLNGIGILKDYFPDLIGPGEHGPNTLTLQKKGLPDYTEIDWWNRVARTRRTFHFPFNIVIVFLSILLLFFWKSNGTTFQLKANLFLFLGILVNFLIYVLRLRREAFRLCRLYSQHDRGI